MVSAAEGESDVLDLDDRQRDEDEQRKVDELRNVVVRELRRFGIGVALATRALDEGEGEPDADDRAQVRVDDRRLFRRSPARRCR